MITEREDEEAVALIPFHYSQEQERVDDDEDGKGNQDEEAQQEIQHEPSIPKTRVGSFKLLLLLFVTMTPAAAGLFLFLSLAKNQDSPTRLIFTFGDSYTATEFSLSREPPSQSNPLGNPEFPGHTTSGGPNWLGWLLQESPENTLSYNFAIKGRTFHDFPSQASTFLSMASRSSKHYVPWRGINKHIFVVWFGVNDMNSFFTSPSYDVVNRRLEQCFNVVDRLRNAGAENFLFLGIPRKSHTLNPSNFFPADAGQQCGDYQCIREYSRSKQRPSSAKCVTDGMRSCNRASPNSSRTTWGGRAHSSIRNQLSTKSWTMQTSTERRTMFVRKSPTRLASGPTRSTQAKLCRNQSAVRCGDICSPRAFCRRSHPQSSGFSI